MLSLIIPTYNERDNIVPLLKELFYLMKDIEVIIVDDNSPDGTAEVVKNLSFPHLKLVQRKGKEGLSSAVLAGFKEAKGNVLGVMDADLSHPPSAIPRMYGAITTKIPREGKCPDIVIGSRYVKGGKIIGWTAYRKFISKGATILSRPFTKAKDPMSGLFMVRKECIQHSLLNSQGFKILLEILVKSDWKITKEVPITFKDRLAGKSKANWKEYYRYLFNLANFARYKWFSH